MFEHMKAMGAVAGLLKNRERLEEIAERIKDEAERLRVTGEAGGGAVQAVVNGRMKVLEVHLEPSMVAGLSADEQSQLLAQLLIADAVNDGLERAQQAMRVILEREAAELGLPELPEGLTGLLT